MEKGNNTFKSTEDKNNKKRIHHNQQELIIEVTPESLDNTVLSEKGVKNILLTMHSSLLKEGPDFNVYVKKSNALILAKKERVIENKTHIKVYNVIDSSLYVNNGLYTHKVEDTI